jgi:sec-independent protein translocase protein TatA
MPFNVHLPELIVILVIIILLFGVGRVSKLAGEVGKGIREFRKGINPEEPTEVEEQQ